ncbi:hypothetical protein [Kitasatospora sp. NPDC096204]|uniref:hypothetical protein n=1 Tax=Kitasatospora sp. NPDC096204 TaxID=3364094 RepID=UPI0037FF7B30
MESGEYLGQSVMEATLLPSRVAYLIATGDTEGFRQAVAEASSRWGGLTEPIVEISDTNGPTPDHLAVVNAAKVEAVVNVSASTKAAERIADGLGLPCVPLSNISQHPASSYTVDPAEIARIEARQAPVVAMPGAPLWQVTSAGCRPANAVGYARPGYGDDDFGRLQLWGATWLQSTMDQFGEYRSAMTGYAPTVVWVTGPDDLTDCLAFWNTRALCPPDTLVMPMLLLPGEDRAIENWLNFPDQFEGFLSRPDCFTPDVILTSRNVPLARLNEIATLLRLQPSTTPVEIGAKIPAPPTRTAPYSYRVKDPSDWVRADRDYGLVTTFDAQVFTGRAMTLRVPAPVQFSSGSGSALLRFWGKPLDGLPARDCVAQLVDPHASWRGRAIQLAAPGVRHQLVFPVTVPTLQQATERILNDVTKSHQLSLPGRLGQALADRADINALLEPGVYEAAVELTTPRTKQLTKALEQLESDGGSPSDLEELAVLWGGRAERRFWPPDRLGSVRGTDPVAAAERLCTLGWAERGLRNDCLECTIQSFVPLNQTSSTPTCPGCGAVSNYWSTAASVAVHYRLNSFTDRASDNGVLPHLLVIAALHRDRKHSYFLPGTDLVFEGQKDPEEVDIFGIWDEQVLAGEVKTSASQFTDAQLERDVALSRKLGADVHLLAAVDMVPNATRATAERLCKKAGLELHVYDHSRLRPPPPPKLAPATATDGLRWVHAAAQELRAFITTGKPVTSGQAAKVLRTASGGTSPVGGQIAALTEAVNHHGAALTQPLEHLQREAQLLLDLLNTQQ